MYPDSCARRGANATHECRGCDHSSKVSYSYHASSFVRPGSAEVRQKWIDEDAGYCIPPVTPGVRNLWHFRNRCDECIKLADIRNGPAHEVKVKMRALGVNTIGPFAMHHLFIPHFDWTSGAPQDLMHGV